jgi:DNA repair exonuclease SbcCD ATPase subunit
MINFHKITLHNFGSYSHAEIDLEKKGFCLVTGENKRKEDNAKSNGSGKSFIWSGICFALTGQTLQGLKSGLKNIYSEDKDAYVELGFSFGKDEYVVKRIIAPHSDLKIEKNSADVSGKGIRESETALAEMLPDVTQDLLASTILIGQGMPNRFSSFRPSGRKELLEKLTKSDYMIADVKARIEARKSFLEGKNRELSDAILVLKTKYEAATANLTRAKQRKEMVVKPDFDAEIVVASEKLRKSQADSASIAEEIKNIEKEAEEVNERLITLNSSKATEKAQLLESYTKATSKTREGKAAEEAALRIASKKLADLQAHPDVCPTCGQKMPNAEHFKEERAKIEAEIESIKAGIKALSESLAKSDEKNAEYTREISTRYDAGITECSKKKLAAASALSKAKGEQARIAADIDRLGREIQKAELSKASWDKEQASLDAAIAEFAKDQADRLGEISGKADAVKDVTDRLAVVKQLETLTKRDFRGYILADIITYLDKKAKDFAEIVFGHRDIEIALHGNDLDIEFSGKAFDNLSGGEKTRVDLIIQFAIRDLLITYLNASSNVLVLDEVTDFLDKTSCDAVMRLIETQMRSVESVFIVSHHAEELNIPIDSELRVVKGEDGISRLA